MANPSINGIEYDFSSITLQLGALSGSLGGSASLGGAAVGLGAAGSVGNLVTYGIKSIEYSHKVTRSKVRGTHPQAIGRTPGEYEASGSITLYKRYADEFLKTLTKNGSLGIFDAPFDLTVSYSVMRDAPANAANFVGVPGVSPQVVTDKILGCYLSEDNESHSQGTNPLEVRFGLDIMLLVKNGMKPLTNALFA
jgi:hypothetical protein